ncbi:Oxo-4-hydroxy-4-carboxy-5-ureidoimidazoline decarboxylase [Irpex rosettiformis]|uniref:Oxo-4-hydroxy-4-carboxy-5-ureidoimidazoline decarboxylase n=1 Tax=Irpex rosettiformis TaxID=378272 RepID=A0ACB8UBL8_9APHY|nr:Oxo-4-hydroxy-4-carboxy-5-ureidoimidazoline decarboxylase [Irpex rosettiformis]
MPDGASCTSTTTISRMSQGSFPTIEDVSSSTADKGAPLTTALSVLFEPSIVLFTHLAPQVQKHLQKSSISSYHELLTVASNLISGWDEGLKVQFIAGHPRIGEVSNLSKLSAQEQAAKATPPEVLARLAHLNACYEYRYPGLIYITFVNGRSRAQIMEEMEDVLGFARSLSADEPPPSSSGIISRGSEEWKSELDRAVKDVCKIAESRVRGLEPK